MKSITYPSFLKQLKNNAVAMISLFIAISSLSYNTWRNERTEFNRNQRHAAFEILVKANELQQVIFHHHYDKDISDKGNPRTGWTYVLTINDFAQVLDQNVMIGSKNLQSTWQQHWHNIDTDIKSVDAILDSIDKVRSQVLILLKQLD